jgi:hypothetical protein
MSEPYEIRIVCDRSALHKSDAPMTLGEFRWIDQHEDGFMSGWWFHSRRRGLEAVTELSGDAPAHTRNPFAALGTNLDEDKADATRAVAHLECPECRHSGALDVRAERLVPILDALRARGVSSLTLHGLSGTVQSRS